MEIGWFNCIIEFFHYPFAVLGGKDPTFRDLVNESIERFFVESYDSYCKQKPDSDFLKQIREEVLPNCNKVENRF